MLSSTLISRKCLRWDSCVYVLNYSLDTASSLDSLSGVWHRPIRSMVCHGTSFDCMGQPIHSTAYQSTRKSARTFDYKTELMIFESSAMRIFGCV